FLALDVYAPTRELGGQPHVLTLLPDGERQLLVLDDDFHDPLFFVHDGDALDLRGAERVGHEDDRIFRPLDDVGRPAAKLTDDCLDARPLHADTRADGVHVALARIDSHLRAVAGLADRAANHHGAVVDFGDLLLEQFDQQRRIGSRQHNLRTLRTAVHALDDRADALAGRVAFSPRLLLAREHGFDPADFDDQVAAFEPLHGAVDHLADALVVLGEDIFAFGFANLLEDHLLRRLCGNPSEHVGALRELDFHVHFGFFAVKVLRLFERDL